MKAHRQLSVIVLILIALFFTVPTTIPPVHSQTLTKIAINPPVTTNTNILPGHTLTLAVNLTSSPPINIFRVSVLTDNQVLNPMSITSGGFLSGGTVLTLVRCVNGSGMGCNVFIDGAGVATFSEDLLAVNSANPSGTLFTVTYNVTGIGATQIHILSQILGSGIGQVVSNVATIDGYFANKECAPGLFCKPPTLTFSVVGNSILVTQRPVIFNATFAANNPGATLGSAFLWHFGDGNTKTTPNATVTYTYSNSGNFLVVLRASDTDGATGFASAIVRIGRAVVYDLAVNLGSAISRGILVVGESVLISTGVQNLSTQAENATVRITVQNTTLLTSRQFTNLGAFGGVVFFDLIWNTTGLNPGTYQLEARVDPIRNRTTGQIVENVTSNDYAALNFKIVPLPLQPAFVRSELVFDHALSISRSSVETWKATVANPNPGVSLYCFIDVGGSSDTVPRALIGQSDFFVLQPGETLAGITITSFPPFASSDIGLRFQFTAIIHWGPSADIPLISTSVQTGSFTVVP